MAVFWESRVKLLFSVKTILGWLKGSPANVREDQSVSRRVRCVRDGIGGGGVASSCLIFLTRL